MSDLISELQNNDHDPHDDPNSLIKNICISDAATGNIIFERVYKWKETAAFSNLGSLIQVFYQFAREVDEGVISSISFESGIKNTTKKKRNDILQTEDKDTMQMVTLKTKDIIVSVFYDIVGNMVPSSGDSLKLNILLHSVKTLFERKFVTELMENRGKFHNDSSVSESQPITNSSFISNENDSSHTLKSFESFNSIADQLKSQIFPFPQTTSGAGEGQPLPLLRGQREREATRSSRPRTLEELVQQQIANIDINMGHHLPLGSSGMSVGSHSPTN